MINKEIIICLTITVLLAVLVALLDDRLKTLEFEIEMIRNEHKEIQEDMRKWRRE